MFYDIQNIMVYLSLKILCFLKNILPYSLGNKGDFIQKSRGFWMRLFSKNTYFRAMLIQNFH